MFVRNAGETPIYSTVLYYTPNAGSRAGETMEVVFGVVPPGSTHSHPVDGAWRTNEYRQPGVAVAFTDASGGHWRRTEMGELLTEPYAPLTC